MNNKQTERRHRSCLFVGIHSWQILIHLRSNSQSHSLQFLQEFRFRFTHTREEEFPLVRWVTMIGCLPGQWPRWLIIVFEIVETTIIRNLLRWITGVFYWIQQSQSDGGDDALLNHHKRHCLGQSLVIELIRMWLIKKPLTTEMTLLGTSENRSLNTSAIKDWITAMPLVWITGLQLRGEWCITFYVVWPSCGSRRSAVTNWSIRKEGNGKRRKETRPRIEWWDEQMDPIWSFVLADRMTY